MGHIRIRRLTNRDSDFYQIMGPYLARRAIAKDLGDPIWDDDDKEWFIALDDSAVIGFASLRQQGPKTTFANDWVAPDHRDRDVYRHLLAARLKHVRPQRGSADAISVEAVV